MNEKQLLNAIERGDIHAFKELFFLYQPRLIFFLNGLLHDSELAKDMTQDIFLYLWVHRFKISQINNFSSYLYQMSKYMVFNHFDHINVEDKFIMNYLNRMTNVYESEEELLFAKDLNTHINNILSTLPKQRKKVYLMSRKMGLSNSDIALRLNISKRTVENHISGVLSLLKKYLLLLCSII